MAYTDIASIQVRTNKTYAGDELTYVQSLITAVTNYINAYTNRVFEEVAGDKYYYGNGCKELEIDDATAVTALLEYNSDGDLVYTFVAADYELRPLNETAKDRIYLIQGAFSGYKYKVTGKWGYTAACPDDIKMVATEICANLINADATGKKSESIEGYSYSLNAIADLVTTSPIYSGVLDSYKKILI
jgi:hypothetical protein